jgi:uncharacterized protein (DUF1810 family)
VAGFNECRAGNAAAAWLWFVFLKLSLYNRNIGEMEFGAVIKRDFSNDKPK